MSNSKNEDEGAARRAYAEALDRARDEIRKARERYTVWSKAAQANGNGDQAAKLAPPSAAKTFNTWVGQALSKLK